MLKQRKAVKIGIFWLYIILLSGPELLAGERPESADSNIVITVVQSAGEGLHLQIDYPAAFSNHLDVFASTNLQVGGWSLCETNLSTTGFDALTWTDLNSANKKSQFYRVGNADLDADRDGLADAREMLIYRTNPDIPDSDSDGVPDGAEVQRGTDPAAISSFLITLYADSDAGADGYDGYSATVMGGHGPKRSLCAAYGVSYAHDVILLSGVSVFKESSLCIGASDVTLRPVGAVCVQP